MLIGRAWAAVSTEGLLIYSLDDVVMFDPFDLTIDLTPSTVKEALINKEYTAAIVYSFRLNDYKLVSQARAAQMVGLVGPGPHYFLKLFLQIKCCKKIMVIVGFNYLPR